MRKYVMALAMMAMVAWMALPSIAVTEHCPNHNGHPGKIQGGSLNAIVLDAGTSFCVKGGTNATGVLTADGTKTLFDYLGTGQDVSYYVVYGEDEDTTPTTRPKGTTTTTSGGSVGIIVTTTTTLPCYDGEAHNEEGVCVEVSHPIAVTTTVPETTTTVPPVTVDTLPFTGAEPLPLAVGGLLLALSGMGLLMRMARD